MSRSSFCGEVGEYESVLFLVERRWECEKKEEWNKRKNTHEEGRARGHGGGQITQDKGHSVKVQDRIGFTRWRNWS
jgi:hypothetical protein